MKHPLINCVYVKRLLFWPNELTQIKLILFQHSTDSPHTYTYTQTHNIHTHTSSHIVTARSAAAKCYLQMWVLSHCHLSDFFLGLRHSEMQRMSEDCMGDGGSLSLTDLTGWCISCSCRTRLLSLQPPSLNFFNLFSFYLHPWLKFSLINSR